MVETVPKMSDWRVEHNMNAERSYPSAAFAGDFCAHLNERVQFWHIDGL